MSQTTYYTAAKLAGLPGLPTTENGVRLRAEREKWISREREARGGGVEYSIISLPAEARQALASRNTKVGYEVPALRQVDAAEEDRKRQAARAKSLATFNRLPEHKQRPANARLAIIKASNSYIADHQLAKTVGRQTFCHEYDLGRIDVALWVRAEIPSVHPATLRDWIRSEYEQGMMGLVDSYGNRKDQSKIETWERSLADDGTVKAPMADTIASLILGHPHIREKKCNESLRALLPQAPQVSDKSVKRFMDKWKAQNAQLFALASNPDSHKNNYQPAFGSRSEGITGPNQRWEIDATPADLLLTDGRHKIIGICDVGPRRLKFYVTRTERALDNAFAVRNALLEWGVPADGTLVTDQGSPYKTDFFKGLLSDLDINHHICNAYSGDEKPHIERAFQTLSHDLIELLPGYCGHNVSERQAIESRKSFAQRLQDPDAVIEMKMTGEDLQAFCDRWCSIYHNAEHSSLGKSPNQAMAEWPHPIRTITDERALDILLYQPMRSGGRLPIIGKKGIKINGPFYIHELLEAHIGEPCRVFQDPTSLARVIVHVLNTDNVWEFLCIASDPDTDPSISREEVARASRELHAEHKKHMQRMVNAAKKELKNVDLVSAVMAMRERENAEAQGNLVYFPNPTVEHQSAGLAAAALTAAALDQAPEEPNQFAEDAIEAAGRAWLELNEAREKDNKIIPLPTAARPMFGTDLEKYQWLKKNPHLQEYDDARWIGWYENTSEYQLMFGSFEEEQAK